MHLTDGADFRLGKVDKSVDFVLVWSLGLECTQQLASVSLDDAYSNSKDTLQSKASRGKTRGKQGSED